jgi:hypothetical protein
MVCTRQLRINSNKCNKASPSSSSSSSNNKSSALSHHYRLALMGLMMDLVSLMLAP